MSKNETFFVRLFCTLMFIIPLYADITVALLISVENNSKQNLLYKNTFQTCEPFGIITLEKMALKSKECKNAIEIFDREHFQDKLFAKKHLYVQQSYHYEMVDKKCVLYANGNESYSEMLLRNGLALIDPGFNNSEWNRRLKRAQKGAEVQRAGLHATSIRNLCSEEGR